METRSLTELLCGGPSENCMHISDESTPWNASQRLVRLAAQLPGRIDVHPEHGADE